MAVIRWPRALSAGCFLGAALIAAAALAPAGAAPAGAAPADARPGYQYSSMLTAVGLRTQLDSNPEPSSVPDLTDVETPESDGQLDSFGVEDASGHVGNLNGLGALPGLVCEATGGTPFDCSNVPAGTLTGGTVASFPPADPLDAHASYPTPAHALAPAVGSQAAQASVAGGPLSGSGGTAGADVSLLSTATRASISDVGVDAVMSIGSITTTSSQQVDGTSLRSHAEAALSGISIGDGIAGAGFIDIASVHTTSDAVSTPGNPGTDVTSTVIGGASVLGQPATIDSTGVHVTGSDSVPAAVTNAYQQLLDSDLAAGGISVRTAGITRTDDLTGHTVDAGGLLVTLATTVTGAPSVSGGLPAGVPCPIEPVTGQLPVDPCAGVGFSPDAAYAGNIQLGETGILSNAQPALSFGGLEGVTGSGAEPSASGSDAATAPGSTPVTGSPAPAPGTSTGGAPTAGPGVPGAASPTAGGGTAAVGSSTSPPGGAAGAEPGPVDAGQAAPSTAARTGTRYVSAIDPLAGSTRRLLYLFPMMILVGVGVLAGRLRRAPARIPRGGS